MSFNDHSVYMDEAGRKYLALSPKSPNDSFIPEVSTTLREILTVAPRPLLQREIDEAVLAWPYRDRTEIP